MRIRAQKKNYNVNLYLIHLQLLHVFICISVFFLLMFLKLEYRISTCYKILIILLLSIKTFIMCVIFLL